jgi:hypothetical protein
MGIVKDIKAMAEAEGLTVLDITKSKHIKVQVQAPDGRTALIIAATSASDHRATMNQRSRFRKFADGREVYAHVVPTRRK